MNTVTVDTISLRGAGVVSVLQPSKGHRFTLDSVLLAHFCRLRHCDRVLEPGSGTGVISLLLAKKHRTAELTAAEIQQPLADLCFWNVQHNGLHDRITVMHRDIRDLKQHFRSGSFDAIVANPPYTTGGSGRTSPHPPRQAARHACPGGLREWLDLQILLKNKGKFFLICAASRSAELLESLRNRHLEPKRLRFVHPYADRPAALVLIESAKSAGVGLEVLPPLIVHSRSGGYSSEVKQIYAV